jgi:hypothetical protein
MALLKSQMSKLQSIQNGSSAAARAKAGEDAEAIFMRTFEPVLVQEPAMFIFEGSITRKDMSAIWRWLSRDVAPDLAVSLQDAATDGESPESVLDAALPQLIADVRAAVAAAKTSGLDERKFIAQLGGEEVYERLPHLVNILRCRPLIGKAQALGRSSNAQTDEAALGAALQGMPLKNAGMVSVLFHTLVGESAHPSRLISSIIAIAGSAKEAAVRRSGFGPLVEAILAHAQNQVSLISQQNGAFVDAEVVCDAVTRFHRLIRAITGYLELERGARWSHLASEITKTMAQRIEPRLREVSVDVSQSLRKAREGVDRVDSDRLQAALTGIQLLTAVRDARESLALNALFDKIWIETGQNLETLIDRNLEVYKQNPSDTNTAERLNMGIKMAELRFNAEYADVLRRAQEVIEKRTVKQARSG